VLLLLGAGCASARQAQGPATAQEAAARARALSEAGAYGEWFDLVEPARRVGFVAGLLWQVIAARFLDEEANSRWRRSSGELIARYPIWENLEKHARRIDPEVTALSLGLESHPELVLEGIDLRLLCDDILRSLLPEFLPVGPVTELTVEGEAATCRIGASQCRFVRIDHVWYLADFEPRS